MHRVAAALAVVALIAGGLVLAPTANGTAASSLTVITLGRDGKPVRTDPQIVGVHSFFDRYATSDHAVQLKPGSYDVLVDIYGADGTDTLGARRVRVSGPTTIRVDARQGRAIRARLSPAPPAGYRQNFQMDLCDTDGLSVAGYTLGDVLYVIPSSIPTVELAYSSLWQPQDATSHAPRYLTSVVAHHGLPAGGTTTFRQSALAAVAMHVLRGPETGTPTIDLSGSSEGDCGDDAQQLSTSAALPYSFTAHVPAGSWSVSEQGQDVLASPGVHYRAGGHYSATANRAVWGPTGSLPFTGSGHNLYVSTTMFGDPVLSGYGAYSRDRYLLRKGGRTLLDRTSTDDDATLDPVLKARGWYTLTITATRHPREALPTTALSTASSLKLHFYTNPAKVQQVRGYLTRFHPLDLNDDDQAQAATTTTVALGLQHQKPLGFSVRQLPDTVKSVQVWASPDGSMSWHAVRVTHSHGQWAAHVRNGRAGYTSLRSTVADTHGGSSTTEVIRAYAVT